MPALGDAAAFEQHVVAAGRGEKVADREPGLAGADDDRVDAVHGRLQAVKRRPGGCTGRRRTVARSAQAALTSIVTGTPLVSTSNTAERARDCSTISRTFSAGASASIVKLMRICS